MTITYSCTKCKERGEINLSRSFGTETPFHKQTLESKERAALDEKQKSHQKDTDYRHTLTGSFSVPTSLIRRPNEMLMLPRFSRGPRR